MGNSIADSGPSIPPFTLEINHAHFQSSMAAFGMNPH